MKSRLYLLATIALVTAVAGLQQTHASVIVFSEDFTYDGWNTGDNKMNATWTSVVNTPALMNGSGAWPETYLRLNNSTVYTSAGDTMITDDFSLTVTMFCESYGRSNWFAITDATGTNGYYVRWDGAADTQYNGEGRVGIGKITATIAGYQTNPGTLLSSPQYVQSGHLAAGGNTVPFATVTLSWIAATNTLELWVDGVNKQSVVDASFSSFSRIYLSGNANGLYGSVNLSTVPEPASAVAIFAAAGLLACAIRSAKRRRVS